MDKYPFKNPRVCKLIVTYGCNLNCKYCFEAFKTNAPAKRMSLEVAQKIITDEIEAIQNGGEFDGLMLSLFGGEPLLQFDMIRDLCEWLWQSDIQIPYAISLTTNGTLLNREKQEWFKHNKNRITLSVSIDGESDMNSANRGVTLEKIPISFIHETWPEQAFKMTVAPNTVENYADNFITLTQQGYRLEGSHASGIDWPEDKIEIYKQQLVKIAEFYLQNPSCEPNAFFLRPFAEQLIEKSDTFCGAGHHMVAYDYSGKPFPCHMFTPIVWGRDILDEIKDIDFLHPLADQRDEECLNCPLNKCCSTCIAYNFIERGDVSLRDKRACGLQKAEAQVLSAFQVQYYMNKRETLNNEEKIRLKAAYEIYCLLERRYTKE